MITGMALLSFMSNKPWALKFLTQQEYKVLIRITGFVLLFIGILYAVQIMQFEARKRHISSGHDSANNPHREYTTETNIDLLFTTLGNFSTDVLANNNDSYTTDRNRSPYPGEEVSDDMSAKRNSSNTSVSWIPIAESDAKTDKARNNYKMESDTNVSSSLSEEDNSTSQIGWLPDPDTNASAEISVESHSNKTVTRWSPAPNISAPVTAKGCFNSSSETDVLPTADSKVLSAKLSKESGNYSTIETNPFTSVDRNMFTAMMSRNNSGLSQTNLSPSSRNNISAAINTKNYFNVSKRNWLPLQGSNISVDITISDINNYTSETLWLLAPTNNTFNEKNVHSIVPLSSKTTSTSLSSNFNKHCASLPGLFAASLLLFCLNHISDFCVSI